MGEFLVWKALNAFLPTVHFTIDATCPPGGSVFTVSRCCFTHPTTGKQDEPDFMCHDDTTLYLIECKPTWAGLNNPGRKRNNESDVDKLRRLSQGFVKGDYDEQLMTNYRINRAGYSIRIAVAYASKRTPSCPHYDDLDEFVVREDGGVVSLVNPR